MFRNMPVGMRAGLAALAQIDRSMEEASATMGGGGLATLRRVVLPLVRPAVFTALVYSFVTAMTAVSAVIFLVSARHNMATAYIMGRVEAGEYALAIAYSAVLMLVMIASIALIGLLVGRRQLGRRDKHPLRLSDGNVAEPVNPVANPFELVRTRDQFRVDGPAGGAQALHIHGTPHRPRTPVETTMRHASLNEELAEKLAGASPGPREDQTIRRHTPCGGVC